MQFGACADIDKGSFLASVGFDYLELPLNRIAAMAEEEFVEYRAAVHSARIPARAFNCFFPGDLSLTGPSTDEGRIADYVGLALSRMDELGGEVLVFGSGRARSVPEGFPASKARDQLLALLGTTGDVAETHDIRIVVEPLRSAESNIINTVAEGLELVAELDHTHVRLLVDFYHMSQAKEQPDVLIDAGRDMVYHIHVAEPQTRRWPAPENGRTYEDFVNALKAIQYNRTISVEGKTMDMNRDAPQALACLKSLWETDG